MPLGCVCLVQLYCTEIRDREKVKGGTGTNVQTERQDTFHPSQLLYQPKTLREPQHKDKPMSDLTCVRKHDWSNPNKHYLRGNKEKRNWIISYLCDLLKGSQMGY